MYCKNVIMNSRYTYNKSKQKCHEWETLENKITKSTSEKKGGKKCIKVKYQILIIKE